MPAKARGVSRRVDLIRGTVLRTLETLVVSLISTSRIRMYLKSNKKVSKF